MHTSTFTDIRYLLFNRNRIFFSEDFSIYYIYIFANIASELRNNEKNNIEKILSNKVKKYHPIQNIMDVN